MVFVGAERLYIFDDQNEVAAVVPFFWPRIRGQGIDPFARGLHKALIPMLVDAGLDQSSPVDALFPPDPFADAEWIQVDFD